MDSNNIHTLESTTVEMGMKRLILSRNNITTLTSINLNMFHYLEHLDVSHNFIQIFDAYLFLEVPLKFIDISFNELEKIRINELTSLETLYAAGNKLSILETDNKNLKDLRIQNNQITSFDVMQLDLLEVWNVCISYNKIIILFSFSNAS